MEFWGVEIKPGKPLKVTPEEDCLIHISQASLGESKKVSESVPLFVKVGDQKLVLGTLLGEKLPQISFDLIFDQEFELSHNWKDGSVFVLGYKSPNMMDDGDEDIYSDFDDSEEEDLPVAPLVNGKPKVNPVKVEKLEPLKVNEEDSDSDDEDDEFGSDDSDEMDVDEDSEDDESDEEDDETPKKVTPNKAEQGKKRPNESETKTSVQAKKAKIATPLNSEGKKGGQNTTPNPAKAGNKGATPNAAKSGNKGGSPNPAKSGKKGGQSATPNPSAKGGNKGGPSPKSGGLKSNNKAKHSGK